MKQERRSQRDFPGASKNREVFAAAYREVFTAVPENPFAIDAPDVKT